MTDDVSTESADNETPQTALFASPMTITRNPVLLKNAAEDIHQCLRLAQLIANERFSREKQAKEWFASVLETLVALDFKLIEHTRKTIPYTPSDDVLKDVFNGWLPAPQAPNARFKSVATEVINVLKAPEQGLYRKYSTSSHLNVTLDTDDGETLIAILFHVLCTQDPDAPKTRLRLELDHLGAVFDSMAFHTHRESVQAQLNAFANLQ
jgi:hypothetical protein